MTNEYGERLDSHGYAPSVLDKRQDICFLCNRTDQPLQRHEIFHGPYRHKSMRYGCWVCVCLDCHNKLHKGGALERGVKAAIQSMAMEKYDWTMEEWRLIFGKNYEEVYDAAKN